MNSYEEELQKKVERGDGLDTDGPDVKAYQEVFRVLAKDPGYSLPPRFADKVVARVVENRAGKYAKDYFWFGAGIFLLLAAFAATVILTGFRLDFGFLSAMSDYKGLVLFAGLFVVILHWLDKILIRKQTHG